MMWWKSNLFVTLPNAKAVAVKMEMQAPHLEDEELDMILDVYEKVKPYLTEACNCRNRKKGKICLRLRNLAG